MSRAFQPLYSFLSIQSHYTPVQIHPDSNSCRLMHHTHLYVSGPEYLSPVECCTEVASGKLKNINWRISSARGDGRIAGKCRNGVRKEKKREKEACDWRMQSIWYEVASGRYVCSSWSCIGYITYTKSKILTTIQIVSLCYYNNCIIKSLYLISVLTVWSSIT